MNFLFLLPVLRIVFISSCNLFINRFTIMLLSDGISQILVGISSSPMAVLVQFRRRLLISVVGLKVKSSLSLFLLLLLSLLPPLFRIFTIIYQKQMMFLGCVLLQLFST
jgi:hypothetical protein